MKFEVIPARPLDEETDPTPVLQRSENLSQVLRYLAHAGYILKPNAETKQLNKLPDQTLTWGFAFLIADSVGDVAEIDIAFDEELELGSILSIWRSFVVG